MSKLRELVEDERHRLSSARVGLWVTVALALGVIAVDVTRLTAHIPNTVYVLLGTMFTVFASWAAGPRIAQYIGPQIGAIGAALGQAKTAAEPNAKHDDERDT